MKKKEIQIIQENIRWIKCVLRGSLLLPFAEQLFPPAVKKTDFDLHYPTQGLEFWSDTPFKRELCWYVRTSTRNMVTDRIYRRDMNKRPLLKWRGYANIPFHDGGWFDPISQQSHFVDVMRQDPNWKKR